MDIRAKAQEVLGKSTPIAICACGAEIHEDAKFCGKCGTRALGAQLAGRTSATNPVPAAQGPVLRVERGGK